MGDDGGAAFFLIALGLFLAWIFGAFSYDYKADLVETDAMEVLATTIAQSAFVATLLSPTGKFQMLDDVADNFRNAECYPSRPPYDVCSFQTAIQGPGNPAAANRCSLAFATPYWLCHTTL